MLYTTLVVPDTHRALRYRRGKLVAWLGPGRQTMWFPGSGDRDVLLDVTAPYAVHTPELAAVVPAGASTVLDVPFQRLAILSVDGRPALAVPPGKYLLWQVRHEVVADLYDTAELRTSIPEAVQHLVGPDVLQSVLVLPHERVVVYADGQLIEALGPGRYGLQVQGRSVSLVRVDLREQELVVAGQELMTADKVTLRLNVLLKYKIVDPVRVLSEVANLRDALYAEAQLAARRLVASQSLDALLEARLGAATRMLEEVSPRATGWGAQVLAIDLKDLILPGEMKTILNQVIEAEKRAAANVILRREETAATRSLANTAKLLEQNPILVRLKELETLERLAEKVGPITIVASPDKLLGSLRLPGS